MQSSSPFSVQVEYCGSWGYYGQFKTVQQAVESALPGVKVSGKAVPGRTGCLEVYLVKDGKSNTVHSKLNGDGAIGTKNISAVVEKIKTLIGK